VKEGHPTPVIIFIATSSLVFSNIIRIFISEIKTVMKNIHLIESKEKSTLLYNPRHKSFCIRKEPDGMWINDGKVSGADFWSVEKAMNNGFYPYNIYITSDEEVKEGDYFLYDETTIRYKTNGTEYHGRDLCHISGNRRYPVSKSKKIILTTDQDLIEDGVQEIEDEFLEWFVKNPNCEFVEVVNDLKYFNVDELRERYIKGLPHIYSEKIGDKIIIPQEESNQETLEEAAERFYPINSNSSAMEMLDRHQLNNSYKQEGFIAGANWQSERMYSEEDIDILSELIKDNQRKWERFDNKLIKEKPKSFDEIFEQFKKLKMSHSL